MMRNAGFILEWPAKFILSVVMEMLCSRLRGNDAFLKRKRVRTTSEDYTLFSAIIASGGSVIRTE